MYLFVCYMCVLWLCWFVLYVCCDIFFFFKQKTAYEMRISDWISDVCASDLPVLLLRAGTAEQTGLLRFVISAQALWRQRGISVDLVITHEGTSGYIEPVREQLLEVLRDQNAQDRLGTNGGIHVIGIGPGDGERAALLDRVSRVILDEGGGPIGDQLTRQEQPCHQGPSFTPVDGTAAIHSSSPLPRPSDLQFDNGWGGFAPDSGDYVICLEP